MYINIREHNVFLQRTWDSFRRQQGKAFEAGDFLDYTIEDLRIYVRNNSGERHCHYCVGPVTANNFALNLKNPPERGGSHCFHNLSMRVVRPPV